MHIKHFYFLAVIFLFPTACVYADTYVFVAIEKEVSVDGSHKSIILNIDVENKSDSPICILNSDLPRAGYKPQYLDFIGDIELITLSDDGMENFNNINIHQIYANKIFYYSINLEEAYGRVIGSVDVNYSLPIYDCSMLSNINSISELMNTDRKVIKAMKR